MPPAMMPAGVWGPMPVTNLTALSATTVLVIWTERVEEFPARAIHTPPPPGPPRPTGLLVTWTWLRLTLEFRAAIPPPPAGPPTIAALVPAPPAWARPPRMSALVRL